MDKCFAENIVNRKRSAREFLHIYQSMPNSDVADMYGISTKDVSTIISMMIKRYSIRRKEAV